MNRRGFLGLLSMLAALIPVKSFQPVAKAELPKPFPPDPSVRQCWTIFWLNWSVEVVTYKCGYSDEIQWVLNINGRGHLLSIRLENEAMSHVCRRGILDLTEWSRPFGEVNGQQTCYLLNEIAHLWRGRAPAARFAQLIGTALKTRLEWKEIPTLQEHTRNLLMAWKQDPIGRLFVNEAISPISGICCGLVPPDFKPSVAAEERLKGYMDTMTAYYL